MLYLTKAEVEAIMPSGEIDYREHKEYEDYSATYKKGYSSSKATIFKQEHYWEEVPGADWKGSTRYFLMNSKGERREILPEVFLMAKALFELQEKGITELDEFLGS